MSERNQNQPQEPTEGMMVLREIFREMLSEDDVWNGLHEGEEAIRKQAANMRDVESEIVATSEDRQKMRETGATQEEMEQINFKLLGLRALRQQIKHGQEYP